MNFQSVIEKMMPLVQSGSDEPFIIYRDKNGGWHCDDVQKEYGGINECANAVKKQDPFYIMFKGKDFSQGSAPSVYDAVLCKRLKTECFVSNTSKREQDVLFALASFFEDNVGEFSSATMEYLTTLERPLDSLKKMCPTALTAGYKDGAYDEDYVQDAIENIEEAVSNMRVRVVDKTPEKRTIEGYTEKHCVQLAGQSIIFAEKPDSAEPYLVCTMHNNNPFGIEEYHSGIMYDDYVEALRGFTGRIEKLCASLETERDASGLPFQALTDADCIPGSDKIDWDDKLVIIKPESLSPEYRSAEHQLVLVTGGFGARASARGSAVYAKELFSGESSQYRRHQIAGVIDPAKMPEWVKSKLIALDVAMSPNGVLADGTFMYCGKHFTPYRKFEKRDGDIHAQIRRCASDFELGFSTYEWQKHEYSHEGFYAASGGSTHDIFRCVENNKLYVPCGNELFIYKEPQIKSKATNPTLDGMLEAGKNAGARGGSDKGGQTKKPRNTEGR